MAKRKAPKVSRQFGKALDHVLKYSRDDLRGIEKREKGRKTAPRQKENEK